MKNVHPSDIKHLANVASKLEDLLDDECIVASGTLTLQSKWAGNDLPLKIRFKLEKTPADADQRFFYVEVVEVG